MLLLFIFFGLFLLGSAFFSGSETALFSLGRARLLSWRGDSSRGRRLASELMEGGYGRVLAALVLGNMFANSALSMTGEMILGRFELSPFVASSVSITLSVLFLLMFGEITPKAFAITRPEYVSERVSGFVSTLRWLLSPLLWVLESVFSLVLDVLGRRKSPPLSREEYAAFLEMGVSSGAFSEDESELLRDVFRLRSVSVGAVVRGRVDVSCVSLGSTSREVASKIRAGREMFYPVVEHGIDDAVGFLSARDFFLGSRVERSDWASSLIPVVYIPEGTTLIKAFSALKRECVPVGLAVDEYGGVTGVVYLKDIYGELVEEAELGEVSAEWQTRRLGKGRWLLSGTLSLEDVSDLSGVDFSEIGSNTVNGLFCELLDRMPESGDVVLFCGMRFKALRVARNRVVEVEARLPQKKRGGV